jgi:DNA-binding transcriptional LysR family regulator
MLDLRGLRALREVASRGSLSAAAESLDYTQPAISQQVAALERDVGIKLLERGTRPIRLTEAGVALVAHAEAVLARLCDARQELEEIKGLRRGRLRLASYPTGLAALVPGALATFTERHPRVEVSVVDDHLDGVIGRLGRWELDLGLIYEHEALPEPEVELDRTHLMDDPFELVVPKDHRFASRSAIRLEQLRDENWIGGIGAYHSILLRSCREVGFEPRLAYRTDDYRAVQAFVAAGLGVAILPRLALTLLPPGVERVVIRPRPPRRRISAARPARSLYSPAAETMVRVLGEVAATL